MLRFQMRRPIMLRGAHPGAQQGGGGGGFVAASTDWNNRKTAAGVTFASDFSGGSDFVTAATNGGHVFAAGMDADLLALVEKDTTDGITGGCCLRINTPAGIGTNSAAWMFPFSSTFTANSSNVGNDIWIQFRFKIPESRLELSNCSTLQKGWKWANFAQYSITDTDSQSFSNTLAEHVLQDTNQRGLPQAYHRDHNSSFPPFEGSAGGQVTLQTAIDLGEPLTGGDRYCHYPDGTPACFFFPTEEWMTFQVHMQISSYAGGTGNIFDLYVARAGVSTWTHLHHDVDYQLGSPNSEGGGFTHINGGHLNTYETNRINSLVHTYHKYDQVLVGTQEIPIPLDSGVGAVSSELATFAAALSTGTTSTFTITGLDLTASSQSVQSIVTFAARMHWDPVRRRMHAWGTSHTGADTVAGAGTLVTYHESSHAIVRTQYAWNAGQSNIMGHNYFNGTIEPTEGTLYHVPSGSHDFQRKLNATTTWAAVTSIPSFPSDNATEWSHGVEWFQELNGGAGGLAVMDYQQFFWTDAALSSWSTSATMGSIGENGDYWSAKVEGFMHSGVSTTHRRLSSTGAVSTMAAPPIACATNNDGRGTGMVVPHPNGVDLLLLERTSSKRVWKFSQSSNSWGSSIGNHSIGHPYVVMQTVPEHGIVMGWVHEGSGTGDSVCQVYKVPT